MSPTQPVQSLNLPPGCPRGGVHFTPPKLGPGGSGCVHRGTRIHTPHGGRSVESIRVGDQVVSIDIERNDHEHRIVASVAQVHCLRSPISVVINQRCRFSPTHRVYEQRVGWLRASEITPNMSVFSIDDGWIRVNSVQCETGYFEVFDLTTDHPSHTYFAEGLLCHNKQMP